MTADDERAAELGRLYRAEQDASYPCQELACTFPLDGNCDCLNLALAKLLATAIEAGAHSEGEGK